MESVAMPLLRSWAIGVHLFMAGGVLLNGAGDQGAGVWEDRAGTLPHPDDLPGLLMIGAALLAVPAVASVTIAPLLRAQPSVLPALGAVAFLVVVIGGIASRYGFTFLVGSTVLAVLDASLLV